MSWKLSDLSDQSGKTVLITGCTSGVGLHTARHLASHNARIVMACRNKSKMASVASAIRSEYPHAELIELELDTSDLDSVRAFASQFATLNVRIDVLLLNAGIAYGEYRTSKQGFELQFATNHLGHWLLTGLLLRHLTNDARIVAVSSISHLQPSALQFDQMRGDNSAQYHQVYAYAQSKLCNMLFVTELNKRLQAAGSNVIAVGTHPGVASTGILDIHQSLYARFLRALSPWVAQTAERGALPLLMAVVDDQIAKECYYAPWGGWLWKEMWGDAIRTGMKSKLIEDEELREKLWQFSEELCEYTYDI